MRTCGIFLGAHPFKKSHLVSSDNWAKMSDHFSGEISIYWIMRILCTSRPTYIGGMSVAYRSTCRPTIGQLSVDISTDISVEISTDHRPICRLICRPTYRSRIGRYVDRYIGSVSVDMSTDTSVERCTKYT